MITAIHTNKEARALSAMGIKKKRPKALTSNVASTIKINDIDAFLIMCGKRFCKYAMYSLF